MQTHNIQRNMAIELISMAMRCIKAYENYNNIKKEDTPEWETAHMFLHNIFINQDYNTYKRVTVCTSNLYAFLIQCERVITAITKKYNEIHFGG